MATQFLIGLVIGLVLGAVLGIMITGRWLLRRNLTVRVAQTLAAQPTVSKKAPAKRSPADAIDQVINDLLPIGEYGPLRADLSRIRYKAAYQPPELMYEIWDDLAMTLKRHLGDPDVYWKRQIVELMKGETAVAA